MGSECYERNELHFAETHLYLCSVGRENVLCKLADIAPKVDRPERETDRLSLGVLKLDSEWRYSGFELSPVIWIVKNRAKLKSRQEKEEGVYQGTVDRCRSESKKIASSLGQKFSGKGVLNCGDIREAVEEQLKPYFCMDEDEAIDFDADTVLVDYAAYTDEKKAEQCQREARLSGSFFSKDLEMLREAVRQINGESELDNSSLNLVFRYLEGGLGKDEDELSSHHDILKNSSAELQSFYSDVLDLDRVPLGRWPSQYPLALMQQVAVNLVAGRIKDKYLVKDVMSVNGPPGTGKTTLLKDIIAANVVEKAELLATYKKPDAAFDDDKVTEISGGKNKYGVSRFKDERINDLGIIVCSSNNPAVDNISTSLPDGEEFAGGLCEEEYGSLREETTCGSLYTWKDYPKDGCIDKKTKTDNKGREIRETKEIYFSYAADKQLSKSKAQNLYDYAQSELNPGMFIAARLGNSDNRKNFINKGLWPILNSLGINNRLNWPEGEPNLDRFIKARKLFLDQRDWVKSLMEQRSQAAKKVEEQLCAIARNDKRISDISQQKNDLKEELSSLKRDLIDDVQQWSIEAHVPCDVARFEDVLPFLDQLTRDTASFVAEKNRLVSVVKLVGERKGLSRFAKVRAKKVGDAEAMLEKFVREHRADDRRLKLLEQVEGAYGRTSERISLIKRRQNGLDNEELRIRDKQKADINCLHRAEADCVDRIGTNFVSEYCSKDQDEPDNDFFGVAKEAHLRNPTKSIDGEEHDLMRERDKLFVRALDLTREFVLASKCMRDNLYALAYVMGDGKKYDAATKQAAMPALFQSLNVLTPIISSTFASVERLFEDVPIGQSEKAPFGLLIIDEAGQAVPFAAVGALSRCRRALVVGDPSQIEPVVTSEVKMLRRALGKDIANGYKEDSASVQKLADVVNPYGHNRTDDDDSSNSQWVGCPLGIHRRCVSPMFDISNKVSYGGSMINETLPPSEEKAKRFCKESSQWINISGSQVGDKDYYVPKQGEEVVEIVKKAFKNCGGKVPSLFVISPFKTVIAGIKQELGNKKFGCSREEKNRFINSNIGTVHTFQGKEADEVIFVLGCDKRASGVVGFVSPNIVNVAASRAKYRLYIIGDYNVWKVNNSVKIAKRELDVAWVPHWEKYQEYKEQGKGAEAQRELKQTVALLPKVTSIPALSEDEDGALPQFDQEENAAALDTVPYFENVKEALKRGPFSFADLLSDDDCKLFGFETCADLELAFADCAQDNKTNLVLDNLKHGMFLYGLLSKMPDSDWSPSLIMFCNAAELYMRKLLLPSLRKIAPNAKSGHKKGKENVLLCDLTEGQEKTFTLGEYGPILKEKEVRLNLARCYCMGSGQDFGFNPKPSCSSETFPCQEDWWSAFEDGLDKLRKKRNKVAHGGSSKINAEFSRGFLSRLFSSFFPESYSCQDKTFVAIMEQSCVFGAVGRGIEEALSGDVFVPSEGILGIKDSFASGCSEYEESEDAAKKAQVGSLTGAKGDACERNRGNGACDVGRGIRHDDKMVLAEGAAAPKSLGKWDEQATESIRQLVKETQHEKLKGSKQWQSKVFVVLVEEGFLERVESSGKDHSSPKKGWKATQKGLSVGINDNPRLLEREPKEYNPVFSKKAIEYIDANLKNWLEKL